MKKKEVNNPLIGNEWTPVNKGQEFITWSQKSTDFSISGVYQGKEPGKFGDNHVVDIPDIGAVKFSASYAALAELDTFKVGEPIKILHEGLVEGRNGKEYRKFTVFRKSGST